MRVRQRGALEQDHANAGFAQLGEHPLELSVPYAVHCDRVTFGSLKRLDELRRPRLERSGCSKRCSIRTISSSRSPRSAAS